MKVNIGKHTEWFGPYQLAEKIMFWKDKDSEEVYNFGYYLAHGKNQSDHDTWLSKVLEKIDNMKRRKVKVKIDRWDIIDGFTTMSYVILPLLKNLRAELNSTPIVDDDDVPVHLRSINKKEVDENWNARWEYVLDEMIYAHQFIIDEGDFLLEGEENIKRVENGLRLFGKYYMAIWR